MELLKRSSCGLLLLCVMLSPPVHAGDLRLEERQIKAGLLYNFLKYTQWPASSFAQTASFHVCIFGGDPFQGSLKPMESMTVNQRDIKLLYVQEKHEIDGCHLLFVSDGEKEHWPGLRAYLSGKHILTVSDFSAFASVGGMIEFGRSDNHINASLNMDATMAAGLRMEERMLRLVSVVHGGRI